MCEVKTGIKIYNKATKSYAEVVDADDEGNLVLRFDKPVGKEKKYEILSKTTAFGKVLFFSESDASLPLDTILDMEGYMQFADAEMLFKKRLKEERIDRHHREALLIAARKREEAERKRQQEERIKYINENEFKVRAQTVQELKRKYRFDGFCHYTDFSNLKSILDYGALLSRTEASILGFQNAADLNVIEHTQHSVYDYVRLYYRGKNPALFTNEGIKIKDDDKGHMPIPVLLLFNDDILMEYGWDIIFLNGNAARKDTLRFTSIIELIDSKQINWDEVFSSIRVKTDYDAISVFGYDITKSRILSSRQAEVLIGKELKLKHLKKIVFRTPADYKRALIEFGRDCEYAKLYEIDQNRFTDPRRHKDYTAINYLYDYTSDINNDRFLLNLKFVNPIDAYDVKLLLKYKDGSMEEVSLNNTPVICAKNNLFEMKIGRNKGRDLLEFEVLMNGIVCGKWKEYS